MKNLPIGKQEFKAIREGNYVYVDKTHYIHRLLTEGGGYYFLSRPRRFGKSLLINTLKELFEGNKALFEGLFIADKWNFTPYPVIKLDFGNAGHKEIGTEKAIHNMLDNVAESYGIVLEAEGIGLKLTELIITLSKREKVVVLIDEYDKPIIDFLENVEKAKEQRDILKNLYSAIKPLDKYLKFVMLTGVSKFGKESIFSDLNNLEDITIDGRFSQICGYTQEELIHYFVDIIEDTSLKLQLTQEELLINLKKWYDGYSWDTQNFMYNPFSILNFFAKQAFGNYWFSTGTPTFLTKLLRDNFKFDLSKTRAGYNSFDTHNLDNLFTTAVLFQTGYLTMKKDLGRGMFELDYPNLEVQDSMMQYLVAEYANLQSGEMQPMIFQMYEALQITDIEEFMEIFKVLFSAIPSELFLANREAYYHSIVFLTLKLLGYFVLAEVHHARGRLDAIVFFQDNIFIFEFKLNQTPELALEQIKNKGYATPFLKDGKAIYAIGVNMNSETKAELQYTTEKIC